MKKETWMFLSIGLLTGVIITLQITRFALGNRNDSLMQIMGVSTFSTEGDTAVEEIIESGDEMDIRAGELSGEEFDRAFLEEMITHHIEAIELAEQARTASEKTEIRDLAGEIISNQNREVELMQKWQQDWGY